MLSQMLSTAPTGLRPLIATNSLPPPADPFLMLGGYDSHAPDARRDAHS